MPKALLISAVASNHGKTLLTMALLKYFKNSVRPFKCGPDFIDPQFHQKIADTPSINLDGFMMNPTQLRWLFEKYMNKNIAIIEGVMGFYDGMDKSSSAYDIAKILNIPTLLVLDASGSYITLSAVLKGLKEFREDNTIKLVVLNKVSSKMHFELIKKHIEKEVLGIVVVGYIEKNLQTISSRHLGLDLDELSNKDLEKISNDVLKHIDLELLLKHTNITIEKVNKYPFKPIQKKDQHCTIIKDKNFSFIYYDNIEYLKERYSKVTFIDSTKDEEIPQNSDIVILPGGYVETNESYNRVKNSHRFKKSLIEFAKKGKTIYAECAGLIYLGKKIDDKSMSGILDIEFKLGSKRERLGYYYAIDYNSKKILKGHAFHYSYITKAPKASVGLYKTTQKNIKDGGWRVGNIYATYLHSMWRVEEVV